MSTRAALSSNLVEIEVDLRSSKPASRHKALDKLEQILNTRSDELNQLYNDRSIQAETTWNQLVDSAHEGVIQQTKRLEEVQRQQKTLTAAENKNSQHVNVLQKIINLANHNYAQISYGTILEKAFICFGNRRMCKYFGLNYLQIVYRNVLCCTINLENIKISEWSSEYICFFFLNYIFLNENLLCRTSFVLFSNV